MDPRIDVHFTPIPDRVLAEMLRLAAIGAADMVYDLGCGDGRILVAAAREYGARGVGVDIDPARIAESLANIRAAGMSERLACIHEDFFTTDLRPATVVTLYLLDSLNVRLRPKILTQCRPGTRVVSYSFEMGEWECDAHTPIAANGVSLWIVPANLTGQWAAAESGGALRQIVIEQTFQKVTGWADFGGKSCVISQGQITGGRFDLFVADEPEPWSIHGRIDGDRLQASIRRDGEERPWTARRAADTQRERVDAER